MTTKHPPTGSRWSGILYGLVMVLAFGLYTPVAKHWLNGVSPLISSGLMYLSAGVTLLIVLAIRRLAQGAGDRGNGLRLADAPTLSLGVVAGCVASPLLLLGIARVSGTVGSLLGNLEGVFTLVIALLLGDTLKKVELAGAAAILAGGVALSFNSQGGHATEWIGILFITASCLAWAIDNTTTQRLSGRDPLALMATKSLLVGPLSLGIAFVAGHPFPAQTGLVAAIVIGAAGWAASMVCFVMAMRHLGAAKVGSMLALSPFVGAVGSIVGLGESPTVAVLAAGLMMAVGAYLLAHGHLNQPIAVPGIVPSNG